MSAWIDHVKNYQHENKCSYKEAMQGASKTYTKKTAKKTSAKGKGVKEVFTKIKEKIFFPANRLPGDSQKIFMKYRDRMVMKFTVCRKPIMNSVDRAANLLTLGKWDERKKELAYDKMFHLFLIFYLRDGTKLKVEKNERINITTNLNIGSAETMDLPYEGKNTMDVVLDKTQKKMGDHHFFQYNAFENNCQDFVLNILAANGALSEEARKFIKQDAKGLIEKMPSFLAKLAQLGTDTAGKISEVTTGRGRK